MPNRIERCEARALAAMKRLAGVTVTYTRRNQSIELTAIRGSMPVSVESAEGQRVRTFKRDYLIDAVDLDFGSGPVAPAIGDVISDDGHTFEIASLGAGEPPWRWHDRQHSRYRIHTVET